ncbi:MAG: MATE family efflux transporter, partial [Clostridia bacterium]|nr:MATE family efflux transporter [Clostridia bacterium]
MTEGPLWDQILLFALPLAATGILLQLFNAADMAVVGRFSGAAGTEAMAAIGANTFLISLIQNGFNGVVLGVTVVIARERGAGNEPLVRKAAHTA